MSEHYHERLLTDELDLETDNQRDRQKDRQKIKQTDRQTERQTDRKTDRQTERQTRTHTGREGRSEGETFISYSLCFTDKSIPYHSSFLIRAVFPRHAASLHLHLNIRLSILSKRLRTMIVTMTTTRAATIYSRISVTLGGIGKRS